MARRYELSDEEWSLIEDLFPSNEGKVGARWQDHRKILNGMFWILRSGAAWRDLPERYGSWSTVYDRFRLYQEDGTFDKLVERLQIRLDQEGHIDWQTWSVDATVVRAHKSAAGAAKEGKKNGASPRRTGTGTK